MHKLMCLVSWGGNVTGICCSFSIAYELAWQHINYLHVVGPPMAQHKSLCGSIMKSALLPMAMRQWNREVTGEPECLTSNHLAFVSLVHVFHV